MKFCHKPYYNHNYTNLSDICPKPKNLYKLHNAKQTNVKEHRKKIRNQILRLLNSKYLLTERKYFNIFKNQINFVKNQK